MISASLLQRRPVQLLLVSWWLATTLLLIQALLFSLSATALEICLLTLLSHVEKRHWAGVSRGNNTTDHRHATRKLFAIISYNSFIRKINSPKTAYDFLQNGRPQTPKLPLRLQSLHQKGTRHSQHCEHILDWASAL